MIKSLQWKLKMKVCNVMYVCIEKPRIFSFLEVARMLYSREKAKLKRAREKARLKREMNKQLNAEDSFHNNESGDNASLTSTGDYQINQSAIDDIYLDPIDVKDSAFDGKTQTR